MFWQFSMELRKFGQNVQFTAKSIQRDARAGVGAEHIIFLVIVPLIPLVHRTNLLQLALSVLFSPSHRIPPAGGTRGAE